MRKYYIVIFTIFFISASAQNKLSKLKTEDLPTSIIIGSEPIKSLKSLQNNTIDAYSFLQAYQKIKVNDNSNRLQNDINVKFVNINNETVSLGAIISSYATINNEAIESGKLQADANQNLIYTGENSAFDINKIGLVSPFSRRHKGLQVNFNLNEIINTTENAITKIEIDFNDGLGFREVNENSIITATYSTEGEKILNSKILLQNGEWYISQSMLKVEYSNSDLNSLFQRAITTFQSTNMPVPNLTPYGESNDIGTGEYDIYLSSDGILDKPIFLVDGFDPGDTRNTQSIYELLNFDDNGVISNLGDEVRANGFDVVVLNFPTYIRASDLTTVDGGADYIERNAMLLAELITIINAQKTGNEPNVVIGPSMGGLISRYALNFMENQNLNHDTRLWISFDSPHLGANVPIGFQYLFNYMAYGLDLGGIGGDQSIVAIRPIIDGMLKSPAARQMLTDHFEPHLNGTSNVDFDGNLTEPIAHPFHDLFFNGLNNLTTSGFPENLRKVSIINGSGINARYLDKTGQPILPAREVLNTTIEDVGPLTDATFRTRFSPLANNTDEMAYIFIDAPWICFCDLTTSANTKAFSYTDGIDAASGGLFDLGALSGALGTDPTINAFFDGLQTDYFNFIPSVSALALEVTNDEIDWFHAPSGLVTQSFAGVNSVTPFDNWFIPDDNEPHITLTRNNVDFALEEIMPSTLSTISESFNELTLVENPVKSNLIKLSSSKILDNSNVTITNITGQIVFNETLTINKNTEINTSLNQGIYLMTIISDEGIKTFKIMF